MEHLVRFHSLVYTLYLLYWLYAGNVIYKHTKQLGKNNLFNSSRMLIIYIIYIYYSNLNKRKIVLFGANFSRSLSLSWKLFASDDRRRYMYMYYRCLSTMLSK